MVELRMQRGGSRAKSNTWLSGGKTSSTSETFLEASHGFWPWREEESRRSTCYSRISSFKLKEFPS